MRKSLNFIFYPIGFLFALLSKLVGFYQVSILVGMIPLQVGEVIRYSFYRTTMLLVGRDVLFSYGCHFTFPEITIGDYTKIGYQCTFGLVDIWANVLMGPSCSFISGKNVHNTDRKDIPIWQQGGKITRIKIGNDVWVGAGAIIMSNVEEGAIVGAGSVVTSLVNPYSVVAGNPARVIKDR